MTLISEPRIWKHSKFFGYETLKMKHSPLNHLSSETKKEIKIASSTEESNL